MMGLKICLGIFFVLFLFLLIPIRYHFILEIKHLAVTVEFIFGLYKKTMELPGKKRERTADADEKIEELLFADEERPAAAQRAEMILADQMEPEKAPEEKTKENKEEKDTVLAEDAEKVAEDAAKEKVDEAKETAADEGADKKAPDAKDAAAKAEADKAVKLQQQFVRLQADFANYKKRTAAEKLQISEVVKMDVITNILPVIDNFERALQVPQDKVADDVKSFIDGYEMIYKQLLGVLEKEGVTKIDAVGKPFDPNYHQAVMRVPSDEYDDDVVVEVLQEGYLLGDKTLRPAMVKVAFNG